MSEHARLSPSSAARWINCQGSLALEESLPKINTDTEFSREGTAAHELAQWTLTDGAHRCDAYTGKITKNGWKITKDMAEDTQEYVDRIIDYSEGHKLFVEKKVDISPYLDVPGQFGTSDAIIITADGEELIVCDLKFGRGIPVYADGNEQMLLYALGAYHMYEMLGDFKRVRLVIHQPRIGNLSEWDCTVAELMAFAQTARKAAVQAVYLADKKDFKLVVPYLKPGEKQCQWCKAKAICPALGKAVEEVVGAEFADLTLMNDVKPLIPNDPEALAIKMNAVDMIETFCSALRAETERALLAGQAVPGWKIVQGKQGNRSWTDKDVVEDALKKFRLKMEEMYNLNLISPTDAEKLLKKDNPRRWQKLQEFIKRTEGKPSVAPASDKRPALDIKPVVDEFTDLGEEDLV